MKFTPQKRFRPARRGIGRFPVWFVSALLGMIIFGTSLPFAQEGEPREGVTFWLLDDDGNWKVPLPNWSVDDVTSLLDQNQQRRETVPFTMMSLEIDGEVSGTQARLAIEYKISLSLLPGSSGPIRVPLGMKEGIFRPESNAGEKNFTVEGPGEAVLDVDSDTGGYAVLIYPNPSPDVHDAAGEDSPSPESAETEEISDAPSADEHTAVDISIYTVRLTLLFPVLQTDGSDERVLFLTPPPAVSSQARIVVPLPDVEISTSEGVIASAPVSLGKKSSELKVYGFNRGGASTAIRWRPAEKNEAALPVTYHVENATVDLSPTGDGIECDVSLPIRVFGGSQSASSRLLRVELPKGARPDMQNVHALSGGTDIPGAVYREIPATDIRPLPAIEVSIPGNIDSLLLRLEAFVPTVEENKWECTGFHLEEAQKETGEIIVRLPDDDDILPGLVPGAGVRDIGQLDTAEGGGKSARFRFYKEPFSLKSDPIPRQTRLIAQPEYQVLVSGQEVRLKARVAYSAYGAPLRSVRIRNPKWLFADFDDESGIDSGNIYVDPETDETVLPLKKQLEGDFTLSWEAVYETDVPQGTVEFEIPEPIADWVAPATVTVVPDDNIELIPLPGRLRGLTPKKFAGNRPTIELPSREQTPLVYQVQREGMAEGESPLFASRFVLHTGEVSVGSSLSIRLDRTPAELVQTLVYHVRYVPVQSFDFIVPQEISPLRDMEIFLNGKPVTADLLASEKGTEGIDITRRTIRLPAPGLIGEVRLEFRAGVDLPTVTRDQSYIMNIPLAVPVAAHLETSGAEVTVPLEYSLHIPEEEKVWKETNSSQREDVRHFGFSSSSSSLPQWLPLRVVLDENAQTAGGLIAEYIWAQTFLDRSSYFERISCRVSGRQPTFSLRLPEGADAKQMAVGVNGVSIAPEYDAEERELRIPLPESAKTEPALVSIWYLIPRGEHVIEFPDLKGETMIRRCYLQLVLPANTLLRQIPRGWSSEEDELGRHLTTQQLAAAVGMSSAEGDAPPKTANVYLLSSFNPPTRVHIHLISQTAVILIGSGLILLFGIAYFSFPRLRYAEAAILSVTVSLSLFLFRPRVILFYLQSTVIGAILILVFLLLRHRMKRRKVQIQAPVTAPAAGRQTGAPAQEKSRGGSTAPVSVGASSRLAPEPSSSAPPPPDPEPNPPAEESETEES